MALFSVSHKHQEQGAKSRQEERYGLPNLIILGAMKCATTSLHYYLGLHPEIFMSREKELNFFVREGNWNKGIEWYKSNFAAKARIRGESSPNYANYPFSRGVPERIYSCVPEAKLIYIVRDPISRIISHYMHQYAVERENRKLSEALANLDANPYVCRSKYFMQLQQYLEFFPPSNILIVTQEELYSHRQRTLKEVFRFLEVDDSFHCRDFFSIRHKSSGKRRRNNAGSSMFRMFEMNILERLPSVTRRHLEQLLYLSFSHKIEQPMLNEGLTLRLIDHIENDTNHLREYTGCKFEQWCA